MAGTFLWYWCRSWRPRIIDNEAIKAIEKADVLIAPKTEKKRW